MKYLTDARQFWLLTRFIKQKIISIDLGSKKSGLAISDNDQLHALPLVTIDNSLLEEKLYKYGIENICGVIIGHPLDLENRPSLKLGHSLHRVIDIIRYKRSIPILLWDERFSSQLAMQQYETRSNNNIDHLVAAGFLESYIYYKDKLKANVKT